MPLNKGYLSQITNSYYSQDFELNNEELRKHFRLANREIDKVKEKVNELVVIVHKDNKQWSLKKICEYLAGKNDDLSELGFSSRTIYNYLNEQNRQLAETKFTSKKQYHQPSQSLEELRNEKGIKLENNVIEPELERFQAHVPEQSPRILDDDSTAISPIGLAEEDEEEEESKENEEYVGYDLQKQVWRLEQKIVKLRDENKDLKEKLTPFEDKVITIVKDQELQFIVKVDPSNRKITSLELNQKEIKKTK